MNAGLEIRRRTSAQAVIYEFDGEMLKMCYGPDGVKRPSEFKSAVGSKHVMIVFKRIKE